MKHVKWIILAISILQSVYAQDLTKYQSHELYPYLIRSKQILDRLLSSIQNDSISSNAFIKMDAEAERNEHQFLSTCLNDELKIIDNNATIAWQKINVLNYGADPTGVSDSRQAFINAVAAAKSMGSGAEIWVPNGTYSFSGTCELYGLKNMKFTGDNATFIFNSVSAGLDVRQCRNFEVTGISIDYKQLPWTQGTLTGIVGNDVYVKFDNGYTELQNWHNASLRFYDPATKLLIHSAYRWTYDKPNVQKQGDGSWKLPSLNPLDGRMPLNQVPIGSKVVILSRKGEDTYHYGLQFPSDWTYNAINLIGDEYVTFRNVNVYAAWEADVCANGTNSGIRYINLHIEPKPGTDRLVCGNSDTHVHYTGRKGDFIYNSKVSGGSDDGCDYASLMSAINVWPTDHSFLILNGLDINWTPVRIGDGIWVVNPQGGPYRYFAKTINVENASGQTLVTLDRAVPSAIRSLSGNLMLGVNSKFDGNILLNNEWSNGSANGIYLYSSNSVVENNSISHFFYWGSLFRMTSPPFWTAGGATRNLLYTGNTVNNNLLFSTSNDVPGPDASQCLFRHFTITNNRFTGTDPLKLNYVSNSVLSGNIFNISGGTNVSILNSCGDIIQPIDPVATQSSTDAQWGGAASRAIDGNTNSSWAGNSITLTYAEANPWWTLDQQYSKPILQLKITNRSDCCSERLHDFYVFVSDNPFTSSDPTITKNTAGVSSYYFPGLAGSSVVLDVNRNARYIRVQIPGSNQILSLAEVQLTSGFISTLPLASQSSTDAQWGGAASRAIDGNTNSSWAGNSITETNVEANPWWTLDQQSSKPILQLKITNRSDCCSERLHNFYVFVSDNPFTSSDPLTTKNTAGVSSYYFPGLAGSVLVLDVNRNARYVRVQIPGSNQILSLAEVQLTSGFISTWPLASQSSTETQWGGGAASRAIDGNTNSLWSGNSITLTTTEANPWWTLDQKSSKPIVQLKITNRGDCCSERLHDFYVFVSDNPFTSTNQIITKNTSGVSSYYFPGLAGSSVVLDVNRNARYIRVQIPGSYQILSMAEVELTSGLIATLKKPVITNTRDNNSDEAVSIHPNPSKDVFFVSLKKPMERNEIIISTIQGEVLYKEVYIDSDLVKIALDEKFSSGIYVVSVVNELGCYRQKLVVAK